MDLRILDRVRCPKCVQPVRCEGFAVEQVQFPAWSGGPAAERPVVRDGVLLCDSCKTWYPIANYVPVMLPFSTPFHAQFAQKHASDMNRAPGFHPADGQPRPGERFVQETFSDQWNIVQNDELTFSYTSEQLVRLNQEAWLKWLPSHRQEIRSILNVGVGLGAESVAVQEAVGNGAEIFGIDLNFALLQSGPRLKARPGMHIFMASLFAIPFAPQTFDLVYSQGVIHHTYSTRDAFGSISRYPRPDGFLFVWIYGLDDHLVPKGFIGLLARLRYWLEIFRPIMSYLPGFVRTAFFFLLTVLLHPLIKSRMWNKEQWRWKNTDHALRDWFSPRYAYRHSYNEMLEWYDEEDFNVFDVQSPRAYRKLFGRRLAGVGMTGRRRVDAAARAS